MVRRDYVRLYGKLVSSMQTAPRRYGTTLGIKSPLMSLSCARRNHQCHQRKGHRSGPRDYQMRDRTISRKAKLYLVTQGKGLAYVVGTSKREAVKTASLRSMGLPTAKTVCSVTVSNGPDWEKFYDLDVELPCRQDFLPHNWKANVQIGADVFHYFYKRLGHHE